MAGSVAEERLRAKAEAYLRAAYPQARIIHELVLSQGGRRIDLAAVGEDHIALAEIKSELDVLTRLPDQVRAAVKISNHVSIVAAGKSLDGIVDLNLRELWWCDVLREAETGLIRDTRRYFDRRRNRVINPQDLLAMLWASELRAVCQGLDVSRKATRTSCIAQACEMLTGREVRRRVCAQLRQRPFPRAD